MTDHDAIVDDLLRALRPLKATVRDARLRVDGFVGFLADVFPALEDSVPRNVARKKYAALQKAVQATVRAFRALPADLAQPLTHRVFIPRTGDTISFPAGETAKKLFLDQLKMIDAEINHLPARGMKPKSFCAMHASHLMQELSLRKISKGPGFYEVARLLWLAMSGKDESLKRACDAWLDYKRRSIVALPDHAEA
jgi:hypothetical protein